MKHKIQNGTKAGQKVSQSSENEESDCTATETSSMSGSLCKKGKKSATQFSVLRSDADGLRMKISAIRRKTNESKQNDSIKYTDNNNLKSSKVDIKRNLSTAKSCMSAPSLSETPSLFRSKSIWSNLIEESDSEASISEKLIRIKSKPKRKKVGKIHEMKSPSAILTTSKVGPPPFTLETTKNTNYVKDRSLSNINQSSAAAHDDNIGLSSSDNELPALVNAAIKCVESDSDSLSVCTQPKIQYTSTLLQDFMAKTQMLSACLDKTKVNQREPVMVPNTSLTSNNDKDPPLKRKRGRPRKIQIVQVVNESADSGVVSSTAQSTSPSPKVQPRPRSQIKVEHKIDITSLDKRVYAMNDRVLYPPPKSKMRKPAGTVKRVQNVCSVNSKAAPEEIAPITSNKEGSVDPAWRKIDVNSKFRRPSVSGYKSDGPGGATTTICSKILTAKNGYASDYGMRSNHYSGYKSDASGKSRCSMKSCYSRTSRTKSCDGKHRTKLRRKRKQNINRSKSTDHLNEQDILQLAGLSLGQSSEDNNKTVACKPKILPEETEIPSAYKKYSEIDRFVTTGEYFCIDKDWHTYGHRYFESKNVGSAAQHPYLLLGPMSNKSYSRSRKNSLTTADVPLQSSRKVKSRRSSVASYCSSSFYSAVSKSKKRRRRKSLKFSCSKLISTDSDLLAEIEIITDSFATMCRIHCDKSTSESGYSKTKNNTERAIAQKSVHQNKRNIKKRKLSENVEFVLTNGPTTTGKRRHKKQCNSSPDDHKLPLKKRHYLLTPGEKTDKIQDIIETKVVTQKSNAKTPSSKTAVTPKKRHLLQSGTSETANGLLSSINDSKIASIKTTSADNVSIDHGKKRNRLEGVVSKMIHTANSNAQYDINADSLPTISKNHTVPTQLNTESTYPPPGVFEPSVELEIQIPITKLAETSSITTSEVESPLDLLQLHNKALSDHSPSTKLERVVETLLNKTGGNLIFKRKRKKINRTGFPNVKRKKTKTNEVSIQQSPDQLMAVNSKTETVCDRVPQTGEASATFLERNRTPRLSVVSLDRLQGTANTQAISGDIKPKRTRLLKLTTKNKGKGKEFESRRGRKPNSAKISAKPLSKKTESIDPIKVTTNPNLHITFPVCKIRLKRRLAALTKDEMPPAKHLAEDVSNEDTAKVVPLKTLSENSKKTESECIDFLEQEPLPPAFCDIGNTNDSESSSSVSVLSEDSKSTNRKQKWKKTFLTAGLLSEHYKVNNNNVKKKKLMLNQVKENISEPVLPISGPLLPPPPYCEKFFRRTQVDFQLPFDIWWAYTNDKLPSRVTVPSWNYRKIRTNVYRCPDIRPNAANIDRPTCNCKPDLGCGDDCLNRMVYTECYPSSCPTGEKCQNQKIQRHEVAPGVERFMTENKGWGVRTIMPIKKGTYILEYVGEVVTEREFKDRMATLYMNDTHHYCLHLDGGLVIDGHRMGSDGRFVNHSCSPNCEMQKWSVNGLSRMALFAARNIEAGEELCYDYNFSLFNPSEGQECRCNTPQCRGVIGGKSQRIKPLIEQPKPADNVTGFNNGRRTGRQRKRQGSARKDVIRLQSKDIVITQLLQQLPEKDKRLIKSQKIFLIRNFEKVRRIKTKKVSRNNKKTEQPASTAIQRRPSTPSSLAVQISALRSPRNIQTRGLTQAVHDPELEKMAKMAVIFRGICSALEAIKDASDKPQICKLYTSSMKRKGKQSAQPQGNLPKHKIVEFPTIQMNIEKGFYKDPIEFDNDMENLFTKARELNKDSAEKLDILKQLYGLYTRKKSEVYNQLIGLVSDRSILKHFRPIAGAEAPPPTGVVSKNFSAKSRRLKSSAEDIIDCICGLFKDEGLMIQCARCMVWQHTECTKADIKADSYLCEKCEPRTVNREICLDEYTEDGCRYYLSLMRGDLQIRQGDAVYVLRDIPIKDEKGNITRKHTYETIGEIDYSECDIFRVERLWKDKSGKRVVFGHHFLRPHETFHEPSRRFYPNEVVRVPLYEVVPIDLIIGRCWVLDRTTYCKGRPADCTSEDHVFICELRVDRSARFFSKAKINWPTCTKSYAFKKFDEKLKVAKTYAPHDVDPSLLKPRRSKGMATASTPLTSSPRSNLALSKKNNQDFVMTRKHKRNQLEIVLTAIKKLKSKNTHLNESVMDVSYLLSGRGARQRKPIAANVPI